MLFNSYEFILLFLPLSWAGYFLLARNLGKEWAIAWLVAASLFFYGWWNPVYIPLLVGSMLVNFFLGEALATGFSRRQQNWNRVRLTTGIALNLGLLGYFKYANFMVDSVNRIAGTTFPLEDIVLPLAISFFTFQQIAYLVDAQRGLTREYSFLHYSLFVTFFPQLIAGPIVHHGEMLPQFSRWAAMRPRMANLAIGITIFGIGLFKKVVLADGIAVYATPVFDNALAGNSPNFFHAWSGALSYTFQLYFDFSGYSDMAIGIARMFGITLPLNFYSPYKATSIVEFWRRWHMTLSRFLRDYVYIGLGGNRRGSARRYGNLMTTMLLGGLWHGAGWTFVAWGGLHGLFLVINHWWTWLVQKATAGKFQSNSLTRFLAWLVTFLSVVVAWVFFRAESFDAAVRILAGMAGQNGISIPNAIASRIGGAAELLPTIGIDIDNTGGSAFIFSYLWIAGLFLVSVALPNTYQIMSRVRPALKGHVCVAKAEIEPLGEKVNMIKWVPSRFIAIAVAAITLMGLLSLSEISEFLYFQF